MGVGIEEQILVSSPTSKMNQLYFGRTKLGKGWQQAGYGRVGRDFDKNVQLIYAGIRRITPDAFHKFLTPRNIRIHVQGDKKNHEIPFWFTAPPSWLLQVTPEPGSSLPAMLHRSGNPIRG